MLSAPVSPHNPGARALSPHSPPASPPAPQPENNNGDVTRARNEQVLTNYNTSTAFLFLFHTIRCIDGRVKLTNYCSVDL